MVLVAREAVLEVAPFLLSQAGITHLVGKHLEEANAKRAEADSVASSDPLKAEQLRNEAKAIEGEYGVAESFNARERDLTRGVHYHRSNKYALLYANQAAYMSDNCGRSNGQLFKDVLQRCLWVLPLREWVGYWQGNHRLGEIIGMDAFSPQEISKEYAMRLKEIAASEQDEFFSLVA